MDEPDQSALRDSIRKELRDAHKGALEEQLSLSLPKDRRRRFYFGLTYMAMAPFCVAIGLVPLKTGKTVDFVLWLCGGLLLLTLGAIRVKQASTEEKEVKRRLKKLETSSGPKPDAPPTLRRVK